MYYTKLLVQAQLKNLLVYNHNDSCWYEGANDTKDVKHNHDLCDQHSWKSILWEIDIDNWEEF